MLDKIKKYKPKHKITYLIIITIVLLVGLRMALPGLIKDYLNDYLAHKVESYTGHIEDFDLSLWRGAYQVEGFNLKKKTSSSKNPFIYVEEADISVSWKALFRGKFLVDLVITNPKLNFTDSKKKEDKQFGVDAKEETWENLLDKLVPFNLESLNIVNGEIHLLNESLRAPLALGLKEVNLLAKNIHNSKGEKGTLFSTYELTAIAQKNAKLYSKGSFNILASPMAMDINLKLEKLNLTELNTFLKAYVPLDITSGELNFYMELATRDKKIKGYLKPMLENMDVRAGKEEVDDSFKEFGYEIIMATVNVLLKNSKSKSLATKIPLEGTLDNPKIGVWEAVKLAIKNGFGKPEVEPKIDNEINLKDVPKDNPEKKKESKNIKK